MASLQLPNCKKKSAAHKNGFEVLVFVEVEAILYNFFVDNWNFYKNLQRKIQNTYPWCPSIHLPAGPRGGCCVRPPGLGDTVPVANIVIAAFHTRINEINDFQSCCNNITVGRSVGSVRLAGVLDLSYRDTADKLGGVVSP